MIKNKLVYILATLLILSVPCFSQSSGNNEEITETPKSSKQQLLMEFLQLSADLQELQGKALASEEIIEARKYMDNLFEMYMMAKKPALTEKIKKYRALKKEVGNDAEEYPEKFSEMKSLEVMLKGERNAVLNDPDLKAKYNEYKLTIKNKMIDLDPAAKEKIERKDRISELLTDGAE